jgi:hypothetical protein
MVQPVCLCGSTGSSLGSRRESRGWTLGLCSVGESAEMKALVVEPVMSWSIWGFFEGMGRRVWLGSMVTGGRSE